MLRRTGETPECISLWGDDGIADMVGNLDEWIDDAAGTFVGPDALDMPLSFEGARAANATLGSGVIMVFYETADLHDALRRIAQFFRDELSAR